MKPWTRQQIGCVKQILVMKKKGKTITEITNMCGVTRNTIIDRLKRAGYRYDKTKRV